MYSTKCFNQPQQPTKSIHLTEVQGAEWFPFIQGLFECSIFQWPLVRGLPSLKLTCCTWKWMVPVETRPIFQGRIMLVLGSVNW